MSASPFGRNHVSQRHGHVCAVWWGCAHGRLAPKELAGVTGNAAAYAEGVARVHWLRQVADARLSNPEASLHELLSIMEVSPNSDHSHSLRLVVPLRPRSTSELLNRILAAT